MAGIVFSGSQGKSKEEAEIMIGSLLDIPPTKIKAFIVVAFDNDGEPKMATGCEPREILAIFSSCLHAMTVGDLPGAENQEFQIPYRAGSETRSLACTHCLGEKFKGQPVDGQASCADCGKQYDSATLSNMLDQAIKDANG